MNNIIYILLFASILFCSLTGRLFSQKGDISQGHLFNNQGLHHLCAKEYNKAISAFSKAITINSANKYYHNNIAVSFIKLENFKAAYHHLIKAIAIDRSYVKALSNMAIVCFKLGHHRMAYSYYQKARAINKTYINNRFKKNKIIKELQVLTQKNPHQTKYQDMLNYLKNHP